MPRAFDRKKGCESDTDCALKIARSGLCCCLPFKITVWKVGPPLPVYRNRSVSESVRRAGGGLNPFCFQHQSLTYFCLLSARAFREREAPMALTPSEARALKYDQLLPAMETALAAVSAGGVIWPMRNMLTIEEKKRCYGTIG